MAGTVVVYLNSPQDPQRKETQENIETVLHIGTGDYVLKSPGGSQRVYREKASARCEWTRTWSLLTGLEGACKPQNVPQPTL